MSWVYLILLYVFVQASRFIVVVLLYPFLRYFGYGLDWKEATILTWSGLRGAVALALSLSVKASVTIPYQWISYLMVLETVPYNISVNEMTSICAIFSYISGYN